MENSSNGISSSDRNGKLVFPSPSLPSQPFSLSQGEGDDWNLRDFVGVLKRRAFVITGITAALMAVVVNVTLKQKPEYEGSFQLLVEPISDENTLSTLTPDKERNVTQTALDYDTQIRVLKSPKLMKGIVNKLQVNHPTIDDDSLAKSLNIKRLGETKIIEVSYKSNSQNDVKVVLDEVAEAFLKYSREERQSRVRQGAKFVEKQQQPLQNKVDSLQKSLQFFRQKSEFIDPTVQADQIINQVRLLSDRRLGVNQELAKAHANLTSLEGEQGKLAALQDAPVYQQLIIQLRQLETQISGELARFNEDSPNIQSLKDKRENLLPLLQQEAQRVVGVKYAEVATQVQTLEVQSSELSKAEEQLKQKVEQLPKLARKYNELQRDLQAATESLNRFKTTREILEIQGAQTEIRWELFQPPVKPGAPISPNIPRNLIMGFVASSVLGVGVALLIEKQDSTYHSLDALKAEISLPLLGIIPLQKRIKKSQYPYKAGKFVESLRVLHTNIQLVGDDRPIRSLVVSSPVAGEGKSTIAYHLAQIATSMGLRVLLVDADLRRPRIHSLCNLDNERGLSNLISTEMPLDQAIQQLPQMSKLSAIPAGPIPADPTYLLSSSNMKYLMEEFQKAFDLVIYDAPPMVGLADTSLLAPYTDGVVLVTRIHKTKSSSLVQALDSLKIGRMNILGMVVNAN
ncbi:MAG: polysaccharide biosynthesis tyrosine autokinase [Cyanomargarita calcarea GSE-NOS-MK-12-04C]|uniref:Polysaccharide biosynthesis tyrosine autokinase n=1 Tax=Cyanomargarita calcarea GSE-NOS-MK-12-04C TaxID=2839659 RepID=A0A951UWY6_9CYAN|nr:polysaccharide biosynthesis tyrosine autokinase [Cyanomargarita calcarea GSE-NOS-MK-12-04C]